MLLHRNAFTHRNTFTHKRFCTEMTLHWETFHTDAITKTSDFTKECNLQEELLHTDVLTQTEQTYFYMIANGRHACRVKDFSKLQQADAKAQFHHNFLTIEMHVVLKGCASTSKIAMSAFFKPIETHLVQEHRRKTIHPNEKKKN